jgi:hypothetical protein
MRKPFTKEMANLPKVWEDWCKKGKYSVGIKRRPAKEQLDKNKKVRGFYSDFILKPTLAHTDSLYPSMEHVIPKSNDGTLVVEARIINDMKSHLGENEFWMAIEHLYAVGLEKGKVSHPASRKDSAFRPKNNYSKPKDKNKDQPDESKF